MEKLLATDHVDRSLSVESGDETQPSPTFLKQYEEFLLRTALNDGEDSDSDCFPDETILREEYKQMKYDSSEKIRANKSHNLTTSLPGRHNSFEINKPSDAHNGSISEQESGTISETKEDRDERSGLNGLNRLIEKLETVRQCGENGNSIFCSQSELEAIQECYGQILDYMQERSSSFEKTNNSTTTPQETDEEEDVETCDSKNAMNNKQDQNEDMKLLEKKLESVQKTRDKFFEVEQHVQEQIEQLELVERYKMESE